MNISFISVIQKQWRSSSCVKNLNMTTPFDFVFFSDFAHFQGRHFKKNKTNLNGSGMLYVPSIYRMCITFFLSLSQILWYFFVMKSADMQCLVEAKAARRDSAAKIHADLVRKVSKRTAKRWLHTLRLQPSLKLTTPPRRPRSPLNQQAIKKIKNIISAEEGQTTRKIEKHLALSQRSVHRCLKRDLGLIAYQFRKEP